MSLKDKIKLIPAVARVLVEYENFHGRKSAVERWEYLIDELERFFNKETENKKGGVNMIKLTGNVSRKVPIPGTEYSSQSFGAGMEVEVGNDVSLEEVSSKFKEMYKILEKSVKEQIASNGAPVSKEPAKQNSNGKDPITANQTKLINKLVREQQIFGKERIRLLNIKTKAEATQAIKELLSKGPGGRDEE